MKESKFDHPVMPEQPTACTCPICHCQSNQVNSLLLLGLACCATYHCARCGVYFRQPLPDKAAVAQYYQSRYFRYPDAIEQEMARIQGSWMVNRLQRLAVPLGKVNYVEFGAGRGWLVSFMREFGSVASSVGFEPDAKSVQWGREYLHVDLHEGFLADALQRRDISPSDFFLLALVHLLEHLHEPADVLEMLKTQYGKPYIFLEVPNAEWEGPVMELDTFPRSSMGQHFWSFTEESLRILLKNSGYVILACEKDGNPHYWDSALRALRIWSCYSHLHQHCYQEGVDLRKVFFANLDLAGKCLVTAVKNRLGGKYNRLDLPVIRILARADACLIGV